MELSYDFYNRLKTSKMFLANPQKEDGYLGTIVDGENIKLSLHLTNMYELSFVIYEYKNGEKNDLYDKIQKFRLIEVQNVGWFQILSATEAFDDKSKETYKTVKCCMLENVLVNRKISNLSGTFALYDINDTENSLLHIISNECGWSISHVDNELLGIYRTFDISSTQIYNFLTQDCADSFQCIFKFDPYEETISAYKISNIGELTNIILSKKNLLKEWIKDDGTENIVTRMRVLGGDDSQGNQVDIRAVNFGSDYLFNPSFFMNTDWCSQGLVNAWNNYTQALKSVENSHINAIETLKTKQSELTTLKTQLKDIESLISAQSEIIGASVQSHGRVPIPSDTDYAAYQTAVSLYNTYVAQKVSKESEITVKNSEINAVQSTIDSISDSIDMSNYFTNEQLKELSSFISDGDDYQDSTFIVTDQMTDADIIDMKLELKQNASNELAKICQPQYTITIKACNLYSIQDDKDDLISYREWINQLKLGNLITLKLRDDYIITVRLLAIEIDFDEPENITLKFSNKDRLEDELVQLAEIIADAGRTASAYTLKSFGYDKASKQTSSVSEFMSGTLLATKNKMASDDKQQFIVDSYGAHMKRWNDNTNSYDPYQSWWTGYNLLFSSDSFATAKAGIGLFTNSSNETFYGLIADCIVGNLVLTSALTISNSSNTITMNKNGAIFNNCDITINRGVNSIYLNATDGIRLTKNGVSQFNIDANGNVTFSGILYGATGTFSGSLSAGISISSPNINGGNISGSVITSTGVVNGTLYTTTISSGYIQTSFLRGDMIAVGITSIGSTQLNVGNNVVLSDNSIYCGGSIFCATLNSGTPITSNNIYGYIPTIPQYTNQITASNTGYGNIDFLGFDNAAGVNWVQANFETKTTSDIRLKYNIKSLDYLPDELFYSLKPKSYQYKPETNYRKGIFWGLIAQEVENAFMSYGLNPYDYDLIEIVDVRKYTDDGYYVSDKTHRINDKNLIAWMIKIIQGQNERIKILESNVVK